MTRTVEFRSGFKQPWIAWDTDTNQVTVDGRRVPCTIVGCGSTLPPNESSHLAHDHEPCIKDGEKIGFQMAFHLENGLTAVSIVDDETSSVWLTPDYERGGSLLPTETGVRRDPDCAGYFGCHGCYHGLFGHLNFETYDELMGKLKEWSSWTYDP